MMAGLLVLRNRFGTVKPKDFNWNNYYEKFENDSAAQYKRYFEPSLSQFDLSVVLDFACGTGRIAQYFLRKDNKLILCDISKSAIDSCRHRFRDSKNVDFLINNDIASH
jgi:SAM-dependent methyltransferase